jgi:O-antigen/teichoic acid export membrane protein
MNDGDEEHDAQVRAVVSRLFGRDAVYMTAWAAQIVVTTLFTPIMTRLMVPAEYGRAMVAQTLLELLSGILQFGLYTGVQRAYARAGDAAARRVVTLACGLAVVGGVVIYATGDLWGQAIGSGGFSTPIKYSVIWATLTALTLPALGLIRSRDQVRWYVATTFAQSVFAQALAVAFVVSQGRTASEYVLGEIVGQIVAAGVALAVARPLIFSRADRALLTEIFKFSVALVPAAIAAFVGSLSDRLLVHGLLGATALARYSLASNIGGFGASLIGVMSTVWSGRLFAVRDARARLRVVGASRDGLCELASGYTVAVVAASPILLRIWSPPSYNPDGLMLVTVLVALTAIPAAGVVTCEQAVIASGRTNVIAVVTVLGATLNVLLNLLLIPRLGIDGSALASLIQVSCSALVFHGLLGKDRPPLRVSTRGVIVCAAAVSLGSTLLGSHGPILGLRLVLMLIALGFCSLRLLSLAAPDRYDALRSSLAGRARRGGR